MKNLLTLSILCLVSFICQGQHKHESVNAEELCKVCNITDIKTQRTVSYQQYMLQKFQHTTFDTMYFIQYALVSDLISMPRNTKAVSFQTNQGLMYMIVSTDYYPSKQEATRAAEQAQVNTGGYCDYVIKPSFFAHHAPTQPHIQHQFKNKKKTTYQPAPKSTSTASVTRTLNYGGQTRQVAYEGSSSPTSKGNFKIQFSWTKDHPFKTLSQFKVVQHRGGYRQISDLSFENKSQAQKWLQGQGYSLKDFWIYPL